GRRDSRLPGARRPGDFDADPNPNFHLDDHSDANDHPNTDHHSDTQPDGLHTFVLQDLPVDFNADLRPDSNPHADRDGHPNQYARQHLDSDCHNDSHGYYLRVDLHPPLLIG